MRVTRSLSCLALVAIFWIAQLQGVAHGISHLGSSRGVGDHSALTAGAPCVECAAFAQSGAAPLTALMALVLASASTLTPPEPDLTPVAAAAAHAYRSRAPPPALS